MNLEFWKSELHNWVLKFFWTAAFLCGALRMQTIVGMVRVEVSKIYYNFFFHFRTTFTFLTYGYVSYRNILFGQL